ncbi:MAG TPA: efflux RND transporter periplasmic adaptor subunit [Longimicrobiales bacterium]
MKGRTKLILGGVGVAAVAGAASFLPADDPGGEDAAPAVAVTRAHIVDRALAVGTIEPEIEVSVKSKVSGVVRRRFAEAGEFVRAGAPLLEIRPDPTPLELVEARRQLELRGIEVANAARELARQRALHAQGLVSEADFEAAERRHAEAALQEQVARERLALLEQGRVTIADGRIESVVTAPIDGYILEEMVEVGDPVVPLSTYQEGTVLLTMADMSRLVFRGTVDEIDVGRLREGMRAEIRVGAAPDARIEGVLSRIALKARNQDNSTVFPVEITLEETDGTILRAGYSANAYINIEKREDVLVIPERVVTFSGDTAWVTVELGPGQTERRVIETGLSDAINIEVVSGLREGERVLEKPARRI